MSFTKITSRVIAPGAVTAEALAPGVGGGPAIANVQIANSSYSILDDTAVSLSGGYIVINGENFESNVQVLIGNTVATSVTYVSENQIRAQIGSSSAGSKIVYLVNTDTGATAIRVNGLTYSGTPTWVTGSTLTESLADEAISIQLSATSDSNVSYSLVSGSSLPPGISLAANGLLSGTVTGLENDTTYNFTIEATDQENQESPRSFSVNILVADPFFNRNVLLLSGDGTNGAQNNTFLDGSSNNFTITRNGNTTQGTFSPFSVGAGEWSNYFDGSGDYLSVASATALNLATGAFTIEGWMNVSATSYMFARRASVTARGFTLYYDTSNSKFTFLAGDTNNLAWEVTITSTNTFATNQWVHVAITRNASNVFTLWINGVSEGTVTSSVTIADDSSNLLIGGIDNTGFYTGYLSSFRVVKGTAVYTSAFTPSTTPLTAITNTSLLTCQSNRFVDNSTNAFAITRNGDVRVTPFSPFAPTAAYSAGTNGGSGYFDGSGDYLTYGTNSAFSFGTGDFTVEAWVYLTAANGFSIFNVGGATTGSYSFYWNGSTSKFESVRYGDPGGSGVTTNTYAINQWHHVVASRVSGTARIFVNGVVDSGATYSMGNCSASDAETGRAFQNPATNAGYISNLRVVKGSGVTSVTVPTAPLTAITNTSLLLNFTNAGIIDNTGKNVLETVGNAQIDTTTKKYGTGSLEFDGTGDYLVAPSNTELTLNADFTIEGWAYLNASGNYRFLTLGDSVGATGIEIYVGSGNWLVYSNSGTRITGSSATRQVWTYLAVVRSGSTVTLYINGTTSGSTWTSSASFSGRLFVGAEFFNNSVTADTNGFIDDLRITKGVARYTSNFTTPTRAHKLK